MRADVSTLFNDTDFDFAERLAFALAACDGFVMFRDEACEMQSAAQVRRACADENYIHLQSFAFQTSTSTR